MRDLKQLSDEELVQLYRDGTEEAFTEIYSRYEQKLKRLIYYYIPNADDASDVFHEAIIRVFRHLGTYKINKSFSSWIYQIAINCSKNYIGRSMRETHLVEQERFRVRDEYLHPVSPEDVFISESDMEEFNRAVERLKDKFKSVFILRYDHRLKYSEIASILGCSERTVKWRMEKAIEKIAQHLSEKGVI
ncbi:MAG TPA: RNA polymerase sigma factor [Spirochaetota bacterium]|nr:RNA polymerase sigma factor [Spirochaetota bacterium]HOD16939.1 RNA polymerase sigma factor [Spirochaetota bacterium]HPG51185.1 RNA polymerase sigma factor [Spirochaetota bacterium]HQL83492.1 RNA polymerase sigma factor [Spirochaetota bacterium]